MLYSTFVGGIPLDVTEEDIKDLFSRCGLIENLYIAPSDNGSCSYGFVRYSTPEEVIKAVSDLNKWKINGSRLIVDFANDTLDRVKKYKDTQIKPCIKSENKYKNIEVPKDIKGSKVKGGYIYSVYVGNLDQAVTKEELHDTFSCCGCIENVYIQDENMKYRFGFIHYTSIEGALEAVQRLDGCVVRENQIIVELSKGTANLVPKDVMPLSSNNDSSRDAIRQSRLKFYSVYVSHIHQDTTKKEIEHLFSGCGSIQDFFITSFCDSPKQYGFIRYLTPESAVKAVTCLNGKMLKNQSIVVQFASDTVDRIPKDIDPTKTKKNDLSRDDGKNENLCQRKQTTGSTSRPKSHKTYSVYVGHLHPDVTKKAVKDLFCSCGSVQDLFLSDDNGEFKYGFVRFANPEDAVNAITHLNGWKVKNKPIIVDVAHDTIGRLKKGRGSKSIVPTIDTNYQLDEKLASRTSDIESVINRSRLHESYSSLRSKMCSLKAPQSGFNHILEVVDKKSYTTKSFPFTQGLSHRSQHSLQDLSDRIENGASKLAADIFMDKFDEVTKMAKNLMSVAQSSKSKGMKNVSSTQITHSPTELEKKIRQTSSMKSNKNQELKPVQNGLSPSCVQAQNNSPRISPYKGRKQVSPSSIRPSKLDGNLSIFELGRRLKKQVKDENIPQQREPLFSLKSIDDDNAFEDDKELIRKVKLPARGHIYESEDDDCWGTVANSEWASDLFCQVLDNECDNSKRTGGIDCSSSSSCETLSTAESGYSSFPESTEVDSISQSRPSLQTHLRNEIQVKSELQKEKEKSQGRSRLLKLSLFSIPTVSHITSIVLEET